MKFVADMKQDNTDIDPKANFIGDLVLTNEQKVVREGKTTYILFVNVVDTNKELCVEQQNYILRILAQIEFNLTSVYRLDPIIVLVNNKQLLK